MPLRLLSAAGALALVAFAAISQTAIPGKISLSTDEKAHIAGLVRAAGQWCPYASSLYDEGRQVMCARKPEELVRPGDQMTVYTVAIDRSGKPAFSVKSR